MAQRFRRITFISTNWQQLIQAKQINDLWLGDSLLEQLIQQLRNEGMNVARRRLHDGNPPPQATFVLIPLLNQIELCVGDSCLRFDHERFNLGFRRLYGKNSGLATAELSQAQLCY